MSLAIAEQTCAVDLGLDAWELTEMPGKIWAWECLLARADYSLTNPADREQVLYCYAERRVGSDGRMRRDKRYGYSAQARHVMEALVDTDYQHGDQILRRAFRRAKQMQKQTMQKQKEVL